VQQGIPPVIPVERVSIFLFRVLAVPDVILRPPSNMSFKKAPPFVLLTPVLVTHLAFFFFPRETFLPFPDYALRSTVTRCFACRNDA